MESQDMNCEFPPWKPSRPYVCPPDAGPAWRAAYEAGCDMAELEDNLKLTPEERLEKNNREMADHLKRERFFNLLRHGQDFARRVARLSIDRKS
jgi:hypothetical protein